MAHYKSWGRYNGQTVRKHRSAKNTLIIREGDNQIAVQKREIDSLIVALIHLRNA